MDVVLPRALYEQEGSFEFSVDSRSVFHGDPLLRVAINGNEITSNSTLTVLSSEEHNPDGDEIIDRKLIRYRLDLPLQDRSTDDLISVSAEFSTPDGLAFDMDGISLKSHIDFRVPTTTILSEGFIELIPILTRVQVLASQYTIYQNGVDVSHLVPILWHEEVYNDVALDGRSRELIYGTHLDISQLGLSDGDDVGVALSVTTPIGVLTTSVRKVQVQGDDIPTTGGGEDDDGDGDGEEMDCEDEAVQEFLENLELSVADGRLCVGASAGDINKAADEMQELAAATCANLQELNKYNFEVSGVEFELRLEVGVNGDNVTVSGKGADLVVAIAGDGAEDSSAEGGKATATSINQGKTVIAIGGDGGSGASPGKGGDACATGKTGGTSPISDAIGAAGNGGDSSQADQPGGVGGTFEGKGAKNGATDPTELTAPADPPGGTTGGKGGNGKVGDKALEGGVND